VSEDAPNERRTGPPGVPPTDRDGDGPTFDRPWQARAFALAVALSEERGGGWDPFQTRLVEEVERGGDDTGRGREESDPEGCGYYDRWLDALERLVVEEELATEAELRERTGEFAVGERDASEFVDGDPHAHADHSHGHDHSH
jgi:nitrile hydratase accessory protein